MTRPLFYDRVGQTSTTTGTGAFTLGAALTAYQTLATRTTSAIYVSYLILAVDGSGNPTGQWETGYSTTSSANTVLDRTNPTDGSAGSFTAVTFSAGTKQVYISLTSAAIESMNGLAYRTSDQTAQDYSGGVLVPWQADAGGFGMWSGGSATLLTVPAPGGLHYRVGAQLILDSITVGATVTVSLEVNGSALTPPTKIVTTAPVSPCTINVRSPLYNASHAGDTVACRLTCSDTSIDVKTGSWMSVEVSL